MPNHYTTEVFVTGPAADLATFKERHVRPDKDGLMLDFNTVIPMPEILKGSESSSTVTWGLQILDRQDLCGPYASPLEACLEYPWAKAAGLKEVADLKQYLRAQHPDCIEKAERAIEAHKQTGAINWYDWSIANWGTKWNSYEFDEIEEDSSDPEYGLYVFRFQTTWSPPMPVLEKLAADYPQLRFEAQGRDEGERLWTKLLEG